MIQDKIFFDEKDPTGLSYNTPFTFYGSYQGRLWSKAPGGEIKYYTQNSDLSVYATTGSNQFNGNQAITGSLTVTGGIIGTTATSSYIEYSNVANKPTLVSGSSQVTYSGLSGIPSGIVSGSAQIADFGIFATTGSNGFNGSQSITGSLTVTGQVVAQTLNVQQVTSSIVFSSGSNIFGNSLANTQQFTGSVGVTGSLTINGTSAVVGSGTTNYVPKLTAGSTIGNSQIFDNGNIGVNQTTLFAKFSIADSLAATSVGSNFNPGILNIQNTNTTNGNLSLIGFQDASAFINLAAVGAINEVHSASPNNVKGSLTFYTKQTGGSYITERMRIDSSGNLGLGVTPSAWDGSLIRAIQITDNGGSISSFSTGNTSNKFTFVTNNAFYDSAGWKYATNGAVAQYRLVNENHQWHTAPSGTAGNAISFTQAMTLDACGNLLIGETSNIGSTRRELVIRGANGSVVSLGNNTTADRFQIASDSGENALLNNKANTPMIFYTNNTERLRITSTGISCFACQVCAPSVIFNTAGTSGLFNTNITSIADFNASSRSGFTGLTNNCNGVYFGMGAENSGISAGIGFFRESVGWNSALSFYTNCVTDGVTVPRIQEKMRITSGGNVGIRTSSPRATLHVQQSTNDGTPVIGTARDGAVFSSNNGNYGLNITVDPVGITHLQSMRFDGQSVGYNLILQPSACNVGIGTTGPNTKLEVNGNIRVSTNGTNGGDWGVDDAGIAISSRGSTPIAFWTNDFTNQRMRIFSTGITCFACQVCALGFTIQPDQQYRMNGYNGAFSYITNNAGFNGNYNGVGIFSNATNANTLPAWLLDLGGLDGLSRGIADAFVIARRASGGSWNNYLTINGTGITCFATTVCSPTFVGRLRGRAIVSEVSCALSSASNDVTVYFTSGITIEYGINDYTVFVYLNGNSAVNSSLRALIPYNYYQSSVTTTNLASYIDSPNGHSALAVAICKLVSSNTYCVAVRFAVASGGVTGNVIQLTANGVQQGFS